MHGILRIKIRIEQNADCPNKEYNVIFKHFHQNIRAYPRSKKNALISGESIIWYYYINQSGNISHWQESEQNDAIAKKLGLFQIQ